MGVERLLVGMMSGTSLDGIDAVVLQTDGSRLRVLAHHWQGFDASLQQVLLALNPSGPDEVHRAALAANALARAYAQALVSLLGQAGIDAHQVAAIGAHGQTVRHRPAEFDGVGYTVQLLNGALLAELSGIDVVCDFRSRDLAAQGQGAPLVPAFHAAAFGRPGQSQAVLNIGGIANLTVLASDGAVTGFDCGPGNMLLDVWCREHLGQAFDVDGQWAAGGTVQPGLLQAMLCEPFLLRLPPKSTGRDLFHRAWLQRQIDQAAPADARDVQATLAEFTARAASDALHRHGPSVSRLMVCGGGALNQDLMQRLGRLMSGVVVQSTAEAGLPPLQVEAAAFAWLASRFLDRQPGNLVAVTGAIGTRVLGCLYPAR
jgi:anhydro-N-acetylmuramic acid kinase